MNSKFVIFAAISVLLVVGIYASSTSHVSAAKSRSCHSSKSDDGKSMITVCCDIVTADDTGAVLDATCTTTVCPIEGGECISGMKGKVNIEDLNRLEDNVIEDLNALEQNNTKVPKTDLLPDGDLPPLTSDDNDNTKAPKAPKVPEDLGGDDGPTKNPELP